MSSLTTFLWFDTQAGEAANFYVDVFDESALGSVAHYPANSLGEEGAVMTVEFSLRGQDFVALNGGPIYQFSAATSFMVRCETQDEIDHYWNAFLDGGEAAQCGWVTDRFGVTWQVVPSHIGDWIGGPDEAGRGRAMQAMMSMVKLDIAELQRAYEGA